ncbi:MAG: CPBP family intramembrane glutamic endopeptidase, partial [Planctomycetota bacterium]
AHAVARGGGAGEGTSDFHGRWALGAARAGLPLENLGIDRLGPADRLRMVPVVAEVLGLEKARETLEGLEGTEDFEIFQQIYGELSHPATDEGFLRRNGWFGRLALSRGLPDDHALRSGVLREARRAFLGGSIVLFGGFAGLVAGLVLLPLGISRLARGQIRFAYEPPPREPGDRVWLETVTILLAGVIGNALLGSWAMWALLLVPLWPLARGAGFAGWRTGLGLVRGEGILVETGAGILGYVAGIPVFAAGFLAMLLVSRVLGEPVRHPAMEDAADPSARLQLFLATCVWAPLVEEAVFRGAFQRYLRPRMARIGAAAVVGLVFAFVHPQGLAAIPVLMALGGWFAILREWRGTLIPCVAAHAVHNLALVSLAVFVFG